MREWLPLVAGLTTVPVLGMVELGLLVLKCLAVAGGAAVGGFGSGWLLGLLARVTVRRPVPRPMKLTVQLLGAVACGLLVWKFAFGLGGSGWGGSGFGLGSGSGTGEGTGQKTDTAPVTPPTQPTPDDKHPAAGGEVLRIDMLGGEGVREGRFYVVEGDPGPKTLAEVRRAIQARRGQTDKPPLKGIEIVISEKEHSVARNHAAVLDLEAWARKNDLTVTLLRK